MNGADFMSLAPMLIIAGAPIIIMTTVAFRRNYRVIYLFSLLAFIVSFLSIFGLLPLIPHQLSSLLIIDGFTVILSGIIILAGIAVTILSDSYIRYQESEKEEYFIILFVATLGSLILVAANNFVTLFLGLETLSISLYILVAYRRARDHSIEAGVKYLILASVSSAFLLFGMGLIYADTGSLEFAGMARILSASGYSTPLLLTGFGMMMVGLGFKLALVPFHMWTPDVYQGAPVPVATYIATISKGAVMALFLRFFYSIRGSGNHEFIVVISVIAILSMFVGNLLAIRQQNVKRILAYSSISNMGYLLVTLLVGGGAGITAAIFYIISYMITTLGSFSVIALLSNKDHDAEMLQDFKGLFWKRPWVALAFTLALLSLAGIPLTTGFMAKFYVVFTGIGANLWILVASLVINSVIGLYYYLRVIAAMLSPADETELPVISFTGRILLILISAGIVWLGVLPQWLFGVISQYTGLD